VNVAGGHARHADSLGELSEQAVAAAVVAAERPLQLDPEAVWAEGAQQAPRRGGGLRVLVALDPGRHGAIARAARQAHQSLGVALEVIQRRARRDRVRRAVARALVSERDQPAEVPVAGAVLAQQRHVVAVVQRQLRAHDRPHPQRPRGHGELHRPV